MKSDSSEHRVNRVDQNDIIAVSTRPIPYFGKHHKTDAQLTTFRAELRKQLAKFSPASGELLLAQYTSSVPTRADLENLLFYNVLHGESGKAALHGMRFEKVRLEEVTQHLQRSEIEPFQHYYRYRLEKYESNRPHSNCDVIQFHTELVNSASLKNQWGI